MPVSGCVPRVAAVILAVILAGPACGAEDPAVVKADAIRRGDALAEQQKHAEAAAAYQVAVQLEPHNAELRLKLAKAHQGAQQWEEASKQFITVAELRPQDWNAQVDAVRWMLGLSRFTDAAARASALLKTRQDDPDLLVLLGSAKAWLRFPAMGVMDLEPALRRGVPIESARADLRRYPSAVDDQEAEKALRRAYNLAPDHGETRVALAGFLWAAGNPDEGADLLKIAADRNPHLVVVNRAVGLFLAQRGRDREAEKYLRTAAVANDRDSVFALADFYINRARLAEASSALAPLGAGGGEADTEVGVRLADIDWRQKQYARAGQRVDAILAREPAHARALHVKSEVLLAANDFATAIQAARNSLATEPRSDEVRLVLARALEATGDLRGAFEELQKVFRRDAPSAAVGKDLTRLALALGRDELAAEFARHSLRIGSDDQDIQVLLATALLRTGDVSGAERIAAALSTRQDASDGALLLAAAIHVQRGNREAAKKASGRVLDRSPDSTEALTQLVGLEIADGQTVIARSRIDRALARHPRNPAYLLLAARAAASAGDPARVEALLRTVLSIEPGHEAAAIALANTLAQHGRREEAVRILEQTLQQKPGLPEPQLQLATLLNEMGRRDDAIARYERLLADHPRNPEAAWRLARLYADAGQRLDRALELASMAKQARPRDPDVSDTLGWVYVQRGLGASAVPHLEDAVRGAPASAWYRYHLGTAYLQVGSRHEARMELSRVLELDPRFSRAAEVRAALASIGR